MKQIFAFLLFILFISLSQESLKSKDGCDYSIPHYGGCAFPYYFGCKDGVWGCYPRGNYIKKIMKTTKTKNKI